MIITGEKRELKFSCNTLDPSNQTKILLDSEKNVIMSEDAQRILRAWHIADRSVAKEGNLFVSYPNLNAKLYYRGGRGRGLGRGCVIL